MSKKGTGRVSGNDLILTRTFKAPIEDVWESVTKSDRTVRWFGRWEGDARPGGMIKVWMVFEKGDASTDAEIKVCKAPHHLQLQTTGPYASNMEIKLRAEGDTTHLEFTHHLTDQQREGVSDFGPGWEYYLDNLVAYRAGEALPTFEEYYPSQKAYYREQAGQEA